MLLSGRTYNDCYSGMSLNGQFGNENRLKASDANCSYQCWDLRKHQACTDLARAQIGVFERKKKRRILAPAGTVNSEIYRVFSRFVCPGLHRLAFGHCKNRLLLIAAMTYLARKSKTT